MMSLGEMIDIVNNIKFDDWVFSIHNEPFPFLQVSFFSNEKQQCRKWLLSQHMTKSELVQTALKAVLTANEHEVRETFRYKGKPIFGPHFDVDRLVELSTYKENLDVRS